MTAKPCIECGTPSSGSRCADCRPTRSQQLPRSHVAYANNGRWKRLSQRLRKQQPWCTWCGITTRLQTDHVIPESVAAELSYCEENLRVLCATCNNQRQATYTAEEAQHVLTRLQDSHRRRPTKSGRERIAAAQRALSDLGDNPPDQARPKAGKACSQLYMEIIVNKGVDQG